MPVLDVETYQNSLAHYGILRKSGRYPWGSGENPNQRSKTFLQIIDDHKKDGLSDSQIAELYNTEEFPFTSKHVRALRSRAVHLEKQEQIRTAMALQEKGLGPSAIGREMGASESTIRGLLEPGRLDRLDQLQQTADMLKRQVDEKKFVDVGAQVERDLPVFGSDMPNIGISKDKFDTALIMLQEEGYAVATFKGRQVGTGENTTYRVLFKPSREGMTRRELEIEAFRNRENVQLISEKTKDQGRTFDDLSFKPPLSIDPKRVAVRYKEDGGADADGVIYVRPGVKDISMGKSHYAQVRIKVGDGHYLKGMAIYKDDLPPGVDLMFNTNKSDSGNKLDALKPLKRDKDGNVDETNPFGAFPKIGGQILGPDGKPTSAMNILNEQGDWNNWSKNLSRQMLSKQKPELAEAQLALTYERRQKEFDELKALTNPVIKRKLLQSYSDDVDSSAVHLKAAAMPKQATKVLLPVGSMKPDEVFAPTFKDGEKIALVRFPHAGTFEIPELTVNNKNPEARRLFSGAGKELRAPDAIGIHPKVAERLSGADFDGDTVVAIPNNRGQITHRPALEGLKDFDPQFYKVPTPDQDPVNGRYTITSSGKGDQMGNVTNLISDMTVKGATDDELARAVRHSMVVIDAEKHNLDWKASEQVNGIQALKKKYQHRVDPETGSLKTGASTLITKATAQARVPKRREARVDEGGPIDPATGRRRYVETGEKDAQGNIRTFRSKQLAETDDAFTLVSEHGGTEIERHYAAHSNRLKALANEARKEMVNTPTMKRSPSAAKVYEKEVSALDAKLNEALKNAPLERRAQAVANQIMRQRRQANPDMEASEKKKIMAQALNEARARTGAGKTRIEITDKEWEAIQAGAISTKKLTDIMNNTDVEKLKERATPRQNRVMTPAATRRAEQLLRSGATPAEVAADLGIPVSTIMSSLEGR